jgi:tRNA pseudouridine32 synthase/23S rRNA pseudouridine746 synthase
LPINPLNSPGALRLHAPAFEPQPALAEGLNVVFADAHLLVLDKPSGLLSVPGRGEDKQDCLSRRAQDQYPDALIVHRLDMATSGLLLMARSLIIQRSLGQLFERREVHKRYTAVVEGQLKPAASADGWGLIDLPIAVDWPRRPLRIIDAALGKPSQTRWRALDFNAATHSTRVELEPLTGRSHQLRVHLQALGHPMLGDALYAPEAVQAKAPRLLLHACALGFVHPATGERLAFDSLPGF